MAAGLRKAVSSVYVPNVRCRPKIEVVNGRTRLESSENGWVALSAPCFVGI
jgi:hypothetical protein